MSITLGTINGLGLGFEFIQKDPEDEIDESVIVIDFFILRCFIWFGDNE
jgi:hypothetical protein